MTVIFNCASPPFSLVVDDDVGAFLWTFGALYGSSACFNLYIAYILQDEVSVTANGEWVFLDHIINEPYLTPFAIQQSGNIAVS